MDQNVNTAATMPAQRLCSEIKLFDLCDLERCNHRLDRFCGNPELLSRFEQISEDDMSDPREQYLDDGMGEESEDGCEPGYDDELADDGYDDADGWEE